jgi:hypothetical protein
MTSQVLQFLVETDTELVGSFSCVKYSGESSQKYHRNH